jgi:ATP-binding cassette subfamily F protein 3
VTQLALSQVAIEFGATTLIKDVTFTVAAGEKWGIVGRNGTGKTSLIKCITGERQPTRGQVSRTPGLRMTLLDQHRGFGDAETVWEAVADAYGDLYKLEKSLHEQAEALAHTHDEKALERYGRDLERFERQGGYEMDARVDAVVEGLGFEAKDARTRRLENLSGGERGRVGLARQLVAPADVMILDEPTNHLDLDTTRWLEGYLRQTERTVLLISHDRAFLEAVVDHVLHLEGGTAFTYTGDYESFVRQRNERRLTQQRQFEKQQDKIAAESDYIARNLAGQNSRQAKGRRKRLERMPRLSSPIGESGVMSLRLEAKERGGDLVVVAEKLEVAVEGRTLLEDFTVRLERGETVGLLGPNGAGKSTLLKTLMGERGPAAGIARLGPSTRAAYYRQDLAQVPLDKALYDIISDLKPQWERRVVQGHLGRFGFSGDEVQRTASTLSGGERARVALAMLMLTGANLLILDEPTNHLDVESIEVLEDAIAEYDGTVILVSHDRALLRASATTVWALEDQQIEVFDGSFAEWEEREGDRRAQRAQRHAEAEQRRRAREKADAERKAAEEAARAKASSGGAGGRTAERDARRQQRELEKRAQDAERLAHDLETRVAVLTQALEDPTMYDTVEGAAKAAELGRELDAAQRRLDAAMAEWASATEALETITR